MTSKNYCACGCGNEVQTWKNGRTSPFLRGHHMRKEGYVPPVPDAKHYCACGCGTEITPLKSGHISKYVKGHHLKGKSLSMEYRLERTRNRWGKEPVLSPYLKETFISFDEKMNRWTACVKKLNGKWKMSLHANAVYREHYGEIPKGYVVHHKNGQHNRLRDDRPENLMLLPDEWNLRFFPVLAKGFDVPESLVTDKYLEVYEVCDSSDVIFSKLCESLIKHKETS